MQVEKKEIAPTLRSEAHAHEPIICYGFAYKQGAMAGSIGFCPEQAPTLRGGQFDASVLIGKGKTNEE